MSLLMFMDAKVVDVEPSPRASTLTPPYNASSPLVMPAIYTAPSGTHPSIVDFIKPWRGWRYWMAYTPYWQANDKEENPAIVVSNDGYTWIEPENISNPIDPTPTAGYNSDTELVWDASSGKLWLYWRWAHGTETIWCSSSEDGITWTPKKAIIETAALTVNMSPAVVKGFDGQWRMWSIGSGSHAPGYRTAPAPDGPWSPIMPITFDWAKAGAQRTPWHINIRIDEGQYRGLLNTGDGKLCPIASEDGLTFRVGMPVLEKRQQWEGGMYRSTMAPARNGADYDVWYGIRGSGWQICYTRIPMQHWRLL